MTVGTEDGSVGLDVGSAVGPKVATVGSTVGSLVGIVGLALGDFDGTAVGAKVQFPPELHVYQSDCINLYVLKCGSLHI